MSEVPDGFGRCDKHDVSIVYEESSGCPQCTQPFPPTPRPDVEALEAEIQTIWPEPKVLVKRVVEVCKYALELEKRLKTADSLLPDLVEAVKYCLPFGGCEGVLAYNQCGCKYGRGRHKLCAVLTAIKQHRESGEEGKK